MFWTIIGALAAFLSTFSFIPQIARMRKTKSVEDVSLATFLQLSTGVFLWMCYGFYLKNIVIILANAMTLLSLCVLIFLYFKYNSLSKSKKGLK